MFFTPLLLSILLIVWSAEYLGRFLFVRPTNWLLLGKAIVKISLAIVFYYINIHPELSVEMRRTLIYNNLGILISINVLYITMEHLGCFVIDPLNKRYVWPSILFNNIKKKIQSFRIAKKG